MTRCLRSPFGVRFWLHEWLGGQFLLLYPNRKIVGSLLESVFYELEFMALEQRICPSILASDFTKLGEECEAVLAAGAHWLHVDVMDGHFVPNITIGIPVVRALRKRLPDAFLDVHLMISDPDQFAEAFIEAGADLISFHPEASFHPHGLIQRIKAAGAKACLAINPGTPTSCLDYLGDDLDMILVMSVNPGFGGQSFIKSALDKIAEIRRRFPSVDIQVDGGVKIENIASVKEAGANVFVAGSAIYNSDDYQATIAQMMKEIA